MAASVIIATLARMISSRGMIAGITAAKRAGFNKDTIQRALDRLSKLGPRGIKTTRGIDSPPIKVPSPRGFGPFKQSIRTVNPKTNRMKQFDIPHKPEGGVDFEAIPDFLQRAVENMYR